MKCLSLLNSNILIFTQIPYWFLKGTEVQPKENVWFFSDLVIFTVNEMCSTLDGFGEAFLFMLFPCEIDHLILITKY